MGRYENIMLVSICPLVIYDQPLKTQWLITLSMYLHVHGFHVNNLADAGQAQPGGSAAGH